MWPRPGLTYRELIAAGCLISRATSLPGPWTEFSTNVVVRPFLSVTFQSRSSSSTLLTKLTVEFRKPMTTAVAVAFGFDIKGEPTRHMGLPERRVQGVADHSRIRRSRQV